MAGGVGHSNAAAREKEAESAAEWVDIGAVHPWEKNPRKNDGRPVEEVAASIKRFGFGAPIVARKADGRIIAGHTRYKAALHLGLTSIPVRFLDVDPADADLLTLADNRTGELATWDFRALMDVLNDHGPDLDVAGLGWSDEDIQRMLTPPLPDGALPPDLRGEARSP